MKIPALGPLNSPFDLRSASRLDLAWSLTLLSFAIATTACTPPQEQSKHLDHANPNESAHSAILDIRPHLEELTTQVPKIFSESAKWNHSKICPEGSALTPLIRYTYEPGQDSHGFKHYFGRSCAIIESEETELASRALASAPSTPSDASATIPSQPSAITLIPHGPFIWWYESGARMGTGFFDHGTLAIGATEYDPDGKTQAQE